MFANIPEVKLGIIAVSRGCFPMALSERRRAAIKAARAIGTNSATFSASSGAVPTGYSGIYAVFPRRPRLYEQLSIPQ